MATLLWERAPRRDDAAFNGAVMHPVAHTGVRKWWIKRIKSVDART